MNKIMIEHLSHFSDAELISLASELQETPIAKDSKLREIAKEFFNDDDLVNILIIGVPLSAVLADRLQVSTINPYA